VSSPAPVLPPAPIATSAAVRRVMQGNRGRDTGPEVALRSALHRRGLRFRKSWSPPGLRSRGDVAFPARRVIVFVDGCFWHRCPQHGVQPSTNARYWSAKLDRNVARDRRNDHVLAAAGWTVVRVWEHEPAELAAERIEVLVREKTRPDPRPATPSAPDRPC
jgi:DNA mismatch endonuclease (patch repair protein)